MGYFFYYMGGTLFFWKLKLDVTLNRNNTIIVLNCVMKDLFKTFSIFVKHGNTVHNSAINRKKCI